MSMMKEYLEERTDKCVYEDEKGFATYSFTPEGCYIEDVYIRPEHRKSGHASLIGDKISTIARERGCKKIFGSVIPSTKGSTGSLLFLLKYGFRLESASNNFVFLVKDI